MTRHTRECCCTNSLMTQQTSTRLCDFEPMSACQRDSIIAGRNRLYTTVSSMYLSVDLLVTILDSSETLVTTEWWDTSDDGERVVFTRAPRHREWRVLQSQSQRRRCCGNNHVCSQSPLCHISYYNVADTHAHTHTHTHTVTQLSSTIISMLCLNHGTGNFAQIMVKLKWRSWKHLLE